MSASRLMIEGIDWEAELEIPPTAGDLAAPEDFGDKAWDYLTGITERRGITTPWKNFDFRFQPGTFNIIMGQSGSGKSQVTQQLMLHATRDGAAEVPQRALLWSAEMTNEAIVARFVQLAGGVKQPSRDYFNKILDYLAERIWIYKRTDRVTVDELLGIAKFAQRKLGVTMFVIDSLVKIHTPMANSNNLNMVQTDLADKLAIFARDSGMVIILVAHARKGENERQRVDKFSLKGSGGISDMASSLFAMNRNIVKSEIKKGLVGTRTPEQVEQELAKPDAYLENLKNREGGVMDSISLWFNEAGQFVDNPSKVIRIKEIDGIG